MGFGGYGGGVTMRHSFTREKGVRKTFTTDMVAHVWAQQKQSEGQNGKGTLWFQGEFLYSYNTAIARILAAPSGEKIMLIRDEKFSVTTSSHMPTGRIFDGRSFCVPFIGNTSGQTAERRLVPYGDDFHAANTAIFWQRWQDHLAAERKRMAHAWESDLHALTKGHGRFHWQLPRDDNGYAIGRPADFAAAVAWWQEQELATFESYHSQAKAYAEAFGVAVPAEFAAAAAAENIATIVAARLARLADPKRKARAEKAKAKRDAIAGKVADTYDALRKQWLATDDATLIANFIESRPYGAPTAPTIPYHHRRSGLDGVSRQQRDAAREILYTREAENGQGAAIEAKEARLAAVIDAERKAKDAEKFAEWQSGAAGVWCPEAFRTDEHGGAYLRVRGDSIETSQGASVPLDQAVRVFQMAKLIRERHWKGDAADNVIVWTRNGKTISVGHFQVDSFRADGSFKAGCHKIGWPQIEAAARAAGVFDMPASDGAVRESH